MLTHDKSRKAGGTLCKKSIVALQSRERSWNRGRLPFRPLYYRSNSIKVVCTKYSKHWLYTVAHTSECVCSEMNKSWFDPWFSFYFSSLYPDPYIEWYVRWPIWISYLNFKAVLTLPKTARAAKTQKSVSFIWIVWSTLYVYLWTPVQFLNNMVRKAVGHTS